MYLQGRLSFCGIRVWEPVSSSVLICLHIHSFDRHLYQFQALGEDDNETEYSSASYPSLGMAVVLPREFFTLRPLRNLLLTEVIPALNPIIQSKLLTLAPHLESPQILAACGRGSQSALRILRHGLAVEDIVSCDVRSSPNGLWVTKRMESGMDSFCEKQYSE